ncbi:MAG: dihydrodipicolinate synthase family protein [Planctomycetaceae bacterium]|jgi:N-acetylneuraminate lyase|nr:dihydrodipicolinate synthase family protein [Planctomycetaceae bacterium]
MFQGLIAATHTPFQQNGDLKLEVIPKYVQYLLDCKMDALYVNGSTGEGISLSVDERQTALEAFVHAVGGRLPIIAQVGANALTDCQKLAAHAEKTGVTAISACAPSYFKVTTASLLVDLMKEIAAAAPKTPFYYYHIPRFTGLSIEIGRFLKEAETKIPTLRGMKYTDTKTFEYLEALEYGNRKLNVLWGCDEMLLSALAVGAPGAVGSTYPLCNIVSRQVLNAWNERDFEKAKCWQLRSWEYVKVLCRYGDLLSGQRILMKSFGLDLGACRLPIEMMSEEAGKKMLADLKTIGYYDWQGVPEQKS